MKKGKKIGISILAVITVVLLILFLLGMYAKKELRKTIDQELSENLEYESLEVSLINNRVAFTNPEISIKQHTIFAEGISIEGINFYQYLVNKKIQIGNVAITGPQVVLGNQEETAEEGGNKGESGKGFSQDILVREFTILNGKIRKPKKGTPDDKLLVGLANFQINDLAVNPETIKKKIPFEYGAYNFEVDSIKMDLDDLHDLNTGKFTGNDGDFSIDDLRIMSKYGKIEFQEHIPYEKDRFELFIENVSLNDLTWGFENDSLQINNDSLTITAADFEIYRDKQAPDDPRSKSLYSEKLRNLPVKINIGLIAIEESKIVYQEKVKADRPPGEISFHEMEGQIENITNMDLGREDFPETVINVKALFNDEAPVEVDWEFDISNRADVFTISGSVESISANSINSFLRPAMNVEARGGIESLYFTYTGNDDVANGDVRISYKDFKVNILKDDGEEKSSFWSAIANLFISNDAVDDDVNNQDLEVERNKKKSFWNYLWLMVREGALASFI